MQKSRKDVNNFDADFTKEEPVLTPTDPLVLKTITEAKDEFKDFDCVNPHFQLHHPQASS